MQSTTFCGVRFDFQMIHQAKLIPISILKSTREGVVRTMVGLYRGAMYTPAKHEYPVRITIERGKGIFRTGDEVKLYKKGDVIKVPACHLNCFEEVFEETIFIKEGDIARRRSPKT